MLEKFIATSPKLKGTSTSITLFKGTEKFKNIFRVTSFTEKIIFHSFSHFLHSLEICKVKQIIYFAACFMFSTSCIVQDWDTISNSN